MKHRNWSGVQFWTPKEVVYPTSIDDLKQIVLSAKERGLRIRAIGSLHSYNDLCVTPDIQVHTDKLNKVLSIDKNKMQVRVESGIKMKALVRSLAKEGLSLPNQGYILKQSLAGATATATHGTGATGTLSSFIEEIELVDAKGNVQILNPKTNEHLFSAAVVNLGCLGIIYAFTLRCIPLQKLKLTKVKSNLKDCLKELPQLLKTYDHFQFGICPYTEKVITVRYQKTDEPIRNRRGYILHRSLLKFLAILSFEYLPSPRWYFPTSFKTYRAISNNFSCVDESYRILSPSDEGLYVEEEIAVPVEHLESAIEEAKNVILEFSKDHPLMVAAIYVRFVGPDTRGYLSPTLNQSVAYLTYVTKIKDGFRELFQAFENAMFKYRGRPHWGKIHTLTKEKVKELYPQTYDRFVEAKKQLDPDGLFSNAYIHRLFEGDQK
ncbi:MAG: FAD-binding protein [Verrucomicrobia bacterium]|nr:FAD-binding protein [Verrucomicrobiota bacterium]